MSSETLQSGLRSSTVLSDRTSVVLDHIAATASASCETDAVTGQVTFVGPRAAANVFRTLLGYLPDGILPWNTSIETVFGLTNRAISQPFLSLWNTTTRITNEDILTSLPPMEEAFRYYRSYQQIALPFMPILQDTGGFERKLCALLDRNPAEANEASRLSKQLAAHSPRSDLTFYAILFAVLASGCQCCLLAEGNNDLALSTRVFVACSFECMRLADMFVSPSSEVVQATLLLTSVVCNDGNPGVAAVLLGMAARQAQALGMHTRRSCTCKSPACLCVESFQPLWRAILIADSKLSLTYDRHPISAIAYDSNRLKCLASASSIDFWDCTFALCGLQAQWQISGTQGIYEVERESFLEDAAQLRQIADGKQSSLYHPGTLQGTIEEAVFFLHLDFFEGLLHLRAALATVYPAEKRLHHFEETIAKFCSAIRGYRKLRQLSPVARLAWEIMRAVKSAAILLASFEAILHADFTGGLIRQMANSLAEVSNPRDWSDDAVPSTCHAGVDLLNRLISMQSSTSLPSAS